jgi:hypothetical protein
MCFCTAGGLSNLYLLTQAAGLSLLSSIVNRSWGAQESLLPKIALFFPSPDGFLSFIYTFLC